MNPLRFFQRPEYFFNPSQILRRLRRERYLATNGIQLAWGLPIEVEPSSHVGRDIANLGVYEPLIAESICRLLDGGENGVDAGANFGQNTSLMALVAGARARIFAFEPTPLTYEMLATNLERWSRYDLAPIIAERKALSSRHGAGILRETVDLGSYSLEAECPGVQTGQTMEIELTTLDAYFAAGFRAGFMKIDVEGHESALLEGARQLLRAKRIRDIVFEDFHRQPSEATKLLLAEGYAVFRIYQRWQGPLLVTNLAGDDWSAPNYLATADPDRAQARFHSAGWRCFRLRARRKAASEKRQ